MTYQATVQIFVNDTKIYGPIYDVADKEALQADLDRVDAWADRWQLPFNESKCKILHIGRSNSSAKCTMRGTELPRMAAEKDFGVVVDDELNFQKTCINCCQQDITNPRYY